MTGHIYRNVIPEQHVRLFRGAMGAEFLFMDDNASPHRANIVDECLQLEDITRRCNKSNDGCGESNSTVPKNSADEKNCADGAKLCTNETEPSASERKIVNMDISYSDEAFFWFQKCYCGH
ncbi:transposable element Tcb1 transposase [Trichonephila clavipes]|uniref:Transposable element Tcb1 transposase n=1 Tax=Trichonephila clavipes TaxID=2585209 RepID=A0A8X6RMY6_TRICX|nr:transposable element Tcb1 transposase [Trichonephila clavipes]